MTQHRILFATLLLSLPLGAAADLAVDDLPGGTVWYMHADLEQMRSTESGRELYGWFDDEVVVEINEEFDINLSDEVDRVTAFSDTGEGAVVVVEGPVSDEFQDRLLEIARKEGDVDKREHDGVTYYVFGDGESSHKKNGLESLEDGGFFSFAVKGKMIATSDEARLKALIDSKGRISGTDSHRDALFVLTADKDFVQAGMRTGKFADDDDDWDSNILRNTEQAALLVSDQAGMIAIEAKLVSTDPAMSRSIGNIVSGLISLQAFNSEMDPAVASVLRNTRVDVDENVLSISTVLEPSAVIAILED